MLSPETEFLTQDNHIETNVHGASVPEGNEGTEKNVHGNDVPVLGQAEQVEAEQIEAKQIAAKKIEARQVEAQRLEDGQAEASRQEEEEAKKQREQEEAQKAQEQGQGLISEEQFGLIDDIFASAGKLSIGAAMRGVKQGIQDVAALVQPETAMEAASVAVAKGTETLVAQAEAQSMDAPGPARKPAVVIELPPEAIRALMDIKNNKALEFAYQAEDRGEVLGTNAKHGVSFKQDGGQISAAVA